MKGTWEEELINAAKVRGLAVPSVDLHVRGDTMTWPDLSADLEDYKADYGKYPDVLLLDSADDIMPYGTFKSEWEALKGAYKHLRRLAHDKKLRVWTSGQLTKESIEKARVNLRHIGASFAKAQLSHYVLGFAQTQQDREHEDGPKIQLYVLKDSLHGTPGVWLECAASFGNGESGYPGFDVEYTHGLTVA